MTSTMTEPSVEAAVNEQFAAIGPGFGQSDDMPAMTTPLAATAVEYAIVGSTVCLVC